MCKNYIRLFRKKNNFKYENEKDYKNVIYNNKKIKSYIVIKYYFEKQNNILCVIGFKISKDFSPLQKCFTLLRGSIKLTKYLKSKYFSDFKYFVNFIGSPIWNFEDYMCFNLK